MNEYALKQPIMADKSTTISGLSMEPAKNGFIISYCEKTKDDSKKSTYDNCNYNYPKEVFDIDDDNEDNDLQKAFDRFKELAMRQYSEMKLSKS